MNPTANMLFCAYGGVGLVPDPLPPDHETMFASFVVQIDNPGPPVANVTIHRAALLDDSNAPRSLLRRVDHVVEMPVVEASSAELGSFAVYLNPDGTPFNGELPTGSTTLRVRFSLDRELEEFAPRCTLELGGFAAPLVVEGRVDGVWGT